MASHEVRHLGALGWIPDRDQQEAALLGGAVEDLVEELHRTRCVGERRKPGLVQRGQQEPDRDADRLLDVVRLGRARAAVYLEDCDQSRRIGQEGLLGIGTQGT